MAGQGSRFVNAGYDKPKPFIDVSGKTMIERVLDNLAYPDAKYILIAREEHLLQEPRIVKDLKSKFNVEFVSIDRLTEGTACTVLHARTIIDYDTPLMIANSDQIVDIDISKFIDDCSNRKLDGSILTFTDEMRDPKWSFAKINENKFVTEVQEKKPISETATVGIYYFKSGASFVSSALDMIVRNERVNGEFYTCPVYNFLIRDEKKIGIYNIEQRAMHGIGTPGDLQTYLDLVNE